MLIVVMIFMVVMIIRGVTMMMMMVMFLLNYRINTPRKEGGLGKLQYPLLSDLNHQIAKDYGVLLSNEGITLRYSSLRE